MAKMRIINHTIFKMALLLLLLTGLHAKTAKWQDLKSVQIYTTNDFHLQKSVKCLELRTCAIDAKHQKCRGKASTQVSICVEPLKSFDSKLIKRFKKLSPKSSLQNNIRKTLLPSNVTHGFSIDDKGTIWRLNEVKDIIDILGEIDTPAEAQLVLWLHGKYQGKRYRKVSHGYEIITEDRRSSCDGVDDYEEYFSYLLHVGMQGKITKKKLLKHTKHKVHLIKKPAIYLYPLRTQKINVSLAIDGDITTSIPLYNKGWSVVVESNGSIEGQYDYLFYENTLKTIELPKEGWIKQGNELKTWFDVILPKLGLNSKETEQFKEYWLKELKKDALYEIKLFSLPFLTENMTLTIDPKPDTLIRVIFNFKVIEKPYDLKEASITTPKRNGFHVLEWGGMIENLSAVKTK